MKKTDIEQIRSALQSGLFAAAQLRDKWLSVGPTSASMDSLYSPNRKALTNAQRMAAIYQGKVENIKMAIATLEALPRNSSHKEEA